MPRFFLFSIFFLYCFTLQAQSDSKKMMDPEVWDLWNTIGQTQISNDGQWIAYKISPGKGDATLCLYNVEQESTQYIPRGTNARFTDDSKHLIYLESPFQDTLLVQKRRKVDKKDLAKSSLGILDLQSQQITTLPDIESYKIPKSANGLVIYKYTPAPPDTTKQEKPKEGEKKKKPRKESKKTGTKLVAHSLINQLRDTFPFVTNYSVAEENPNFIFQSTGDNEAFKAGLYYYNGKTKKIKPLFRKEGADFQQARIAKSGKKVTALIDTDTSKNRIRPYQLFSWSENQDSLRLLVDSHHPEIGINWRISEKGKLDYSEDEQQLYFGKAPDPILEDTLLLPEEIVNVEVWHYQDAKLHTQQNVQLQEDKDFTYTCVVDLNTAKVQALGSEKIPEIKRSSTGKGNFVLGYNERPYLSSISWEGFPPYVDIYAVDKKLGTSQQIADKVKGSPQISPAGKYIYWYDYPDSNWMAYHIVQRKLFNLTEDLPVKFHQEEDDHPMLPWSYGSAGWTENDDAFLVNDRYDIWQINPLKTDKAKKLTAGRAAKTVYRNIKLDRDQKFIDPKAKLLLRYFNETDKSSGYAQLQLKKQKVKKLIGGEFQYTSRVLKAKKSSRLVFTKQSFSEFPDLIVSDLNFNNPRRISKANPQQEAYGWGSIELYEWTDEAGNKMTGMLVKPYGFDANKKYPMIVNFYEQSSDRLHRHPNPTPGRSTINYSYYTNRGYLIFNPDVKYKIGYPGESALKTVVSGVESLIEKGFVDKENIGVQGHSWGGYQIAYLITKTDLFKCAEAGAPVVNMVSAYGGIRWRTGLSRMFQYERTQSRIGGTLWEVPNLYLENSPIFEVDKINTPVLILHNDNDGAVPWYQGIEFFVALRRLGKPSWMLNYNDEPHWPVKRQNRVDFQIRLAQFFDHYLMDKPLPSWMERGVSAIEKGILQGYEAIEK